MSADNDSKSAAEKKAERSSVIEEHIIEQQRRKDERAFLEELAKRISIAREGRMLSDKQEYSQAIAAYRRFMTITAKSLDVSIEELRPQLFDAKSQKSESLLISSIVFDMLKILDKLDNQLAKEERMLYHKLLIRFSLGQPFQLFVAENLRKFIVYRKTIRHKAEFWATYQAVRTKKFCAVATWAYGSDDCAEVRRLRRFRDQSLSRTAVGRGLVRWYYRNGSAVVGMLNTIPGAKPAARKGLDLISRNLPS